jgi:hypothetical protein
MTGGKEARRIYREAWRVYRSHPVALLLPGAVLFAVFDVPSAILSEIHEQSKLGEILLVLGVQLLGFVSAFLYYGYCEKLANQARVASTVSVRHALVETRYVLLALIASSVIAEAFVAVGLLLFVIPGIYLAARYALVAPAASVENMWPRRALRRSSTLTHERFWLVIITALAMFVLEQVAGSGGDSLGSLLTADETLGRVIGDLAGDMLVGPFAGLVTVTLYFHLRDDRFAAPRV